MKLRLSVYALAYLSIAILCKVLIAIEITNPSPYTPYPSFYNFGEPISFSYRNADALVNNTVLFRVYNSQLNNGVPLASLNTTLENPTGDLSIPIPSTITSLPNPTLPSTVGINNPNIGNLYCGYYICVINAMQMGCAATSGIFCLTRPKAEVISPSAGDVFISGNINNNIPVTFRLPKGNQNISSVTVSLKRSLASNAVFNPVEVSIEDPNKKEQTVDYPLNNVPSANDYYFCLAFDNTTGICDASSGIFSINAGTFNFTKPDGSVAWQTGTDGVISWQTDASLSGMLILDVRRRTGNQLQSIGSITSFPARQQSVNFRVPTQGVTSSCNYYVCLLSSSQLAPTQSSPLPRRNDQIENCLAESKSFCIQKSKVRGGDLSEMDTDISLSQQTPRTGARPSNSLRAGFNYNFLVDNIQDVDTLFPYVALLVPYNRDEFTQSASFSSSDAIVVNDNLTLNRTQQKQQQIPFQNPQMPQIPGQPQQQSGASFSLCVPNNITSGSYFICTVNTLDYQITDRISVDNCTFLSPELSIINLEDTRILLAGEPSQVIPAASGSNHKLMVTGARNESTFDVYLMLEGTNGPDRVIAQQFDEKGGVDIMYDIPRGIETSCKYYFCVNFANNATRTAQVSNCDLLSSHICIREAKFDLTVPVNQVHEPNSTIAVTYSQEYEATNVTAVLVQHSLQSGNQIISRSDISLSPPTSGTLNFEIPLLVGSGDVSCDYYVCVTDQHSGAQAKQATNPLNTQTPFQPPFQLPFQIPQMPGQQQPPFQTPQMPQIPGQPGSSGSGSTLNCLGRSNFFCIGSSQRKC
ncbi:hypothetical protein ABK040_002412 [Willaertia magna]